MEKPQSECSEIGHTNQGGFPEDIDMTKILKILKRYKEAKKNKENDKKIMRQREEEIMAYMEIPR